MREKGDGDNNPHPLQVSPSLEQADPARARRHLLFQLDGRLALVEFILGQGIRSVPRTMILDEEIHRSLFLAIVDVPPRTLGDEEDADDLDERRQTLEERGDTPGPSVVDPERPVGGPGGDDGTEVPGRVVERGQRSTVSGEGELGDQQGCGGTGESETETDEATGFSAR